MFFSCLGQFQIPVSRLPSERCCRTPPPVTRVSREVPSLVAACPALHTVLQPQPFIIIHLCNLISSASSARRPDSPLASASHFKQECCRTPQVSTDGSPVFSCGRHCRLTRHHAAHASEPRRLLVIATACSTVSWPAAYTLAPLGTYLGALYLFFNPSRLSQQTTLAEDRLEAGERQLQRRTTHPHAEHTISDNTPCCCRLSSRLNTASDIGPHDDPRRVLNSLIAFYRADTSTLGSV